jgi:hypothetical protein
VRTNSGCADTLTQSLTINGGNPQAAFTLLNPNTACSGDTISIQNKSTIASGNITKVEIYWDNIAQPGIFELDDLPVINKIYRHKYPASSSTINYTIRFRAYSGGVCINDALQSIKVYAMPDVTISNIPDQCYSSQQLALNFGTEKAGLAGTESYSGAGVSYAGGWIFVPSVAGIGMHTIQYNLSPRRGGV